MKAKLAARLSLAIYALAIDTLAMHIDLTWQSKLAPAVHIEATATAHRLATHISFLCAAKPSK